MENIREIGPIESSTPLQSALLSLLCCSDGTIERGATVTTAARLPSTEERRNSRNRDRGLSFRRNIQLNLDIEKCDNSLDDSHVSEVRRRRVPLTQSNPRPCSRRTPPRRCCWSPPRRRSARRGCRPRTRPRTPPPRRSRCRRRTRRSSRSPSRPSSASSGSGPGSLPPQPVLRSLTRRCETLSRLTIISDE